jgi:hypothetical protein
MLDARVFFFVFLALVHLRIWTLSLAVLMMLVFWFLERRGLSFDSSLRAFRCWILGSRRPANQRRAMRHWVDFG